MGKLDEGKVYWLDSKNIYKAVESLPEQIEKTWERVNEEIKDWKMRKVDKVVIAGMGGSALGGRVVAALSGKYVKLPILIVNEFNLPGYVDKKTLVVLVSYSGNTEEVLSMAEDARAAEAEVVAIGEGGKLLEKANKLGWKTLSFDASLNPGNQPRMAIGENVALIAALVSKIGGVSLQTGEVVKAVKMLRNQQLGLSKEVKTADNMAKKMAERLANKGVVIFAAEHLIGAAHVFKNQLNENAKQWVVEMPMPELNHHLLEGMKFSGRVKEGSVVLIVNSNIYSEALKRRVGVVREIVEKQGWETSSLELEGEDEWEQTLELVNFGEYVAFYTALCNGIDPGPIPWVDYLKEKLA